MAIWGYYFSHNNQPDLIRRYYPAHSKQVFCSYYPGIFGLIIFVLITWLKNNI